MDKINYTFSRFNFSVLSKRYAVIILFLFFTIQSNAQFFNGIGVMGGITYANQRWHYVTPDVYENKKYVLGFNGCVFAEFFQHDFIRWRSEIQFNQKGSLDQFTDALGEHKYKNKLNYLCWNNFLVIRYELFNFIPYILGGPRVEYLLSQSTASPAFTDSHRKLHFSWSVGAGVEFVVFSNFKPMIELHYNPDFDETYKTNFLTAKNRAFELRIGLKYVFKKSVSCPPVYTLLD